MSLDETTKKLGEEHRKWKEAEKEKNALRERFFREASEALSEQLPARSVVQIPAKDLEDVYRICQRRYPKHRVADVQEDNGEWNVVLEEDPQYRSFTYINKIDGQVYQRIISDGSAYL